MTHLIGHLPKEGEHIQVGDYLVTVAKTDGRRIDQLHFKRSTPLSAAEEAAAKDEENTASLNADR